MFFLSHWTLPYLSNRFREFIFKFFNNKLGLNTRTSHFLNTDRRCTFCKLIGISDEDETFSHIFFDCPTVVTIHNTLDLHVLSRGAESNNEKKARWFGCGWLERENKFVRLLHLSLQFFIWECKLKNKLPSSGYILGETIEMLDIACRINMDLYVDKENYICNLSRHWNNLRARLW